MVQAVVRFHGTELTNSALSQHGQANKMKEEMNWVSLTDKQVEIEIDPEYNQPTGVVRFRGANPSVTDTVNCTWSDFGNYKEDEDFDNKVYDEDNKIPVDEIAWAFGCRYAYVTEDATFYWR